MVKNKKSKNVQKKSLPLGVKICGVVSLLMFGLELIYQIWSTGNFKELQSVLVVNPLGPIFILFLLLGVISSLGLFYHRNWARILLSIELIIGAVFMYVILPLVSMMGTSESSTLLIQRILISAAILSLLIAFYLLLSKKVKEAFK